jgi:hypothetical protein
MFAVVQLAVYGGMQIPIGLFLDRYGARPIMTIGMLLMAAGQLTLAFSPSVGVAIFARMLLGAGDAAIFPGVLRLVAVWFPAQRGPLMSQLTGLVGQAGQLLALAPLAAMLHATSWEIVFGGIAGLCVLFGILVWAVIRNHPPQLRADVSVDTNTGAIRVVRSSMDTGVGIRAAWAHPGTASRSGRTSRRRSPAPRSCCSGERRSSPPARDSASRKPRACCRPMSWWEWPSDRSWATSLAAFPTCVRGRSCSGGGHPVRRVDGGDRVAWARAAVAALRARRGAGDGRTRLDDRLRSRAPTTPPTA